MRLLYLHPKAWSGEYAILKKLRELGHQVCVLEEARNEAAAARQIRADFLEPGDGIATLWYNPRRGWEKILTWPVDRIFKSAFDGRNLVHRMWVIREAARQFRPDVDSLHRRLHLCDSGGFPQAPGPAVGPAARKLYRRRHPGLPRGRGGQAPHSDGELADPQFAAGHQYAAAAVPLAR